MLGGREADGTWWLRGAHIPRASEIEKNQSRLKFSIAIELCAQFNRGGLFFQSRSPVFFQSRRSFFFNRGGLFFQSRGPLFFQSRRSFFFNRGGPFFQSPRSLFFNRRGPCFSIAEVLVFQSPSSLFSIAGFIVSNRRFPCCLYLFNPCLIHVACKMGCPCSPSS